MEILYFLFVFLFFYILAFFSLCSNMRQAAFLFLLQIYHFLFSFLFYDFSYGSITDSHNYYLWANDPWLEISGFSGTAFVVKLLSFFCSIFYNDYFFMILFFSGLSFWGISACYISISEFIEKRFLYRNKIIILFFLIPGLHFWTVPIGKDSLFMFALGATFLSIFKNKSKVLFLFSILMIWLLRPHIAFLIIITVGAFYYNVYVSKRSMVVKFSYRFFLILLFLAGAAFSYGFFLDFVQKYSVEGFSSLGEFSESRKSVYADTGSGFDTSTVPVFLRIILFFLGGIPWSFSGFFQLFAMVEGAVILGMIYKISQVIFKLRNIKNQDVYYQYAIYSFIFVFLVSLLLSFGASNLGLMVRQRVMVYIPLFFSFIFLSLYMKERDRY